MRPSRSASSLVDCSPLAAQALTRVPVSKRSSESRAHNIFRAHLTSLPHDPAPNGFIPISRQPRPFSQGSQTRRYRGSVGPNSTAVLVGLQGDVGHWSCRCRISTRTPSATTPFPFGLVFSTDARWGWRSRGADFSGHHARWQNWPGICAVHDHGRASDPRRLGHQPDLDTEADLDLHVDLPSDGDAGVNEIWSRKPSGLPLGTVGATVDAGLQSGYLDFDSNSMCIIDGRRAENVIFPSTPPSGR